MGATEFLVLIAAVSLFLSVATTVHNVVSGRTKATKAELDTLHERMNAHSNRLTAVEEQIKHLPSAVAMASLATQLGELHGDFREMLGEFKALKRQVGNIDDFLRTQGK